MKALLLVIFVLAVLHPFLVLAVALAVCGLLGWFACRAWRAFPFLVWRTG